MVKILGLKSINQWRYANKVDEYLSKISIEEIVQTIDNNPDVFEISPDRENKPSHDNNIKVFKQDDTYAIYINSIRIVITCKDDDKIMTISIMGEDEEWNLFDGNSKKSEGKIDITSSDTKTYTVYTYCDVKIPTGKMILDTKYNNGTWNQYVYKYVSRAIDYIMLHTESNKFNNLYKKTKK